MNYIVTIQGMHCASCVQAVQTALEQLAEVESASVNLLTETAIVRSRAPLNFSSIEEAVRSTGYTAVSIRSEEDTQAASSPSQKTEASTEKKHTLPLKLCLGWIGFVAIMTLMFGSSAMGIHSEFLKDLLIFLISLGISLYIGQSIFASAWQNLKRGSSNMDTLTSMGSSVALLTGGLSLLYHVFPSIRIENFSGLSEMILTLAISGQAIESLVRKKSIGAQRALLDLIPQYSTILRDGGRTEQIETKMLSAGDQVLVYPGSHIPSDALVISGSSAVDESMITGESLPVDKETGSKVIGGTLNCQGQLIIEISQDGKDSVLQNILTFLELAQGTKPKIQLLVDKVTGMFVPIVLILASLSFLGWYFFPTQLLHILVSAFVISWDYGGSMLAEAARLPLQLTDTLVAQFRTEGIPDLLTYIESSRLSLAIYASITVLVIACPCALGLATPAAISVGIAVGGKLGILFRSAEAIERLSNIDIIATDKTGTLTEGKISLVRALPFQGTEEELLHMAATLEQSSEHPLAKAVLRHYWDTYHKEPPLPHSFQAIAGRGITGTLVPDTEPIFIGNKAFITQQLSEEFLESHAQLQQYIAEEQKMGHSISIVASATTLYGLLSFSDTIRESSYTAVHYLQKHNHRIAILSGDGKAATNHIAQQLGITEIHAELSPEDKYNILLELQKKGRVLMLGDGINDAPALLQADLGVAMGSGTDTAKEAGDIILIKEDILNLVRTFKLAARTNAVIAQNLFWAFFYNVLMLPIAFFALISPVFAELAMTLSSITVLLNANRLWLFSRKGSKKKNLLY